MGAEIKESKKKFGVQKIQWICFIRFCDVEFDTFACQFVFYLVFVATGKKFIGEKDSRLPNSNQDVVYGLCILLHKLQWAGVWRVFFLN